MRKAVTILQRALLATAVALAVVGLLTITNPAHSQTTEVYAVFPCKPGTPAPTECRTKVGAESATVPPHIGPTSKKVFCAVRMTGKTGTQQLEVIPATGFGPGPTATATINMADYGVPAALDPVQVLPALPQ